MKEYMYMLDGPKKGKWYGLSDQIKSRQEFILKESNKKYQLALINPWGGDPEEGFFVGFNGDIEEQCGHLLLVSGAWVVPADDIH